MNCLTFYIIVAKIISTQFPFSDAQCSLMLSRNSTLNACTEPDAV